jgi:hypothetical protein
VIERSFCITAVLLARKPTAVKVMWLLPELATRTSLGMDPGQEKAEYSKISLSSSVGNAALKPKPLESAKAIGRLRFRWESGRCRCIQICVRRVPSPEKSLADKFLIMNKYMSLKSVADYGNFRGSFAPQKIDQLCVNCN